MSETETPTKANAPEKVVKATNEPKSLSAAFVECQKAIAALSIVKDAKANYGKYMTLGNLMDVVLPVMHEHDFGLLQLPTALPDGQPGLRTSLIYSPTGEEITEVMPLMMKAVAPHEQGSAITYAKRYALAAAWGVVADEDDDAQGAQKSVQDAAKKAKEKIDPKRETVLYTNLKRLNRTLEQFEAKLTADAGRPTTVKDLTNDQADVWIAQMTALIQRQAVSEQPEEQDI